MIKTFRDSLRKSYNSVARLERGDMRPSSFDMNLRDLGKMHEMRMFYLQNSPNNAKRYEYLRELEVLHDEINYKAYMQVQRRFGLLALAVLTYHFIWAEAEDDKFDFSEEYDTKQFTRSFANLEDGGFEVVL